jgi:hypothetical protein
LNRKASPEGLEGACPELVEGASQNLAKAARNGAANDPWSIVDWTAIANTKKYIFM